MNYRVFTDSQNPKLLSNFEKPVALKPGIGDIILIGASFIPWVITREQVNSFIPPFFRILEDGVSQRITEEGDIRVLEGPTPDLSKDTSFDFFVRVQNTSPDSVSLRRSDDNVQRKLNMFG